MSNEKKEARLRRARSTRLKIRELGAVRLCVNRTPRHIYAQVIAADGGAVLAQASTLDAGLRGGATGNVEAAKKVGALVAERAKAPVSARWRSTVPASAITVVSRLWQMLPVKPVWNSKGLHHV